MPVSFIYAPDRVGKTTYVSHLGYLHNCRTLQFDAPRKGLRNWYDDYDRAFDARYSETICARGPLEANLYRFVPVPSINNYLNNNNAYHILLMHHWDDELIERHIKELKSLGFTQEWRLRAELANRRDFHFKYYAHIERVAEDCGITLKRIIID